MKQKKHITQRDILFLSVSLFVVVLLWVIFNIYHAWVTSTISEDLRIQIIPIPANFDTQTINKLKNRQRIDSVFELVNQPVASESVEEIPTVTPEPLQTEEVTPTEEPMPTEEVTPTEEPIVVP